MKARTTVKVFSWIFVSCGFLGLVGWFFSSEFNQVDPGMPFALSALGMVGFGFLAYLESRQ